MKITQQNDYHRTPSIKSCYSKYVPLAPIEIIFKPNYIFIFLWAFTLSFSFCPKWLVVWLAFFDENNNEQVYGIFLDWRQEPSWSPHSVAWKLSQQLCENSGRRNHTVMFSSKNKKNIENKNSNCNFARSLDATIQLSCFLRQTSKQDNNKTKIIRAWRLHPFFPCFGTL